MRFIVNTINVLIPWRNSVDSNTIAMIGFEVFKNKNIVTRYNALRILTHRFSFPCLYSRDSEKFLVFL